MYVNTVYPSPQSFVYDCFVLNVSKYSVSITTIFCMWHNCVKLSGGMDWMKVVLWYGLNECKLLRNQLSVNALWSAYIITVLWSIALLVRLVFVYQCSNVCVCARVWRGCILLLFCRKYLKCRLKYLLALSNKHLFIQDWRCWYGYFFPSLLLTCMNTLRVCECVT